MTIIRRGRTALTLAALGCIAALLLSTGCKRQSTASDGTVSVGDADGSISASTENMDFSYTDNDLRASYDEANATRITFSGDTIAVDGTGAAVSGTGVTITGGGTYLLSGTLDDGRVIVDADGEKLWLVLDGAAIRCQSGPGALYIRSADKVFLLLAPGSQNTLADSTGDDLTAEESHVDAALFSKADLTINGTGALTVTGAAHGIVCKDEFVIADGTLTVDAAADGIQGKDSVKIRAGALTVTAGDDGIKSNNTEDAARGFAAIDGGTITITAGQDGIQAETMLRITDGNITLKTGGGSANASTDRSGEIRPGWGAWGGQQIQTAEDTPSAKGLKAGSGLQITGGQFTLDTSDDAIHTNGDLSVSGGVFAISSGDDGIHADNALAISGGEIRISRSYEGVEALSLEITGGTLHITASDDGINGAGGADASSLGGRPGQNSFGSGTASLRIAGGYIVVDASGDGIDVNGSLSIEGGTVLVTGPDNDGNGAFDYDGSAVVSGGVVVCVGSSGMAQGFSDISAQPSAMVTLSTRSAAGETVALTDADGNVLAAFTPVRAWQTAVISAPGMTVGETYTLYTGGGLSAANDDGFAEDGTLTGGTAAQSFTLSSVSTTVGSAGGMNPGGGGMNPGGGGTPPGCMGGGFGRQ